jgi:hypothetical protein
MSLVRRGALGLVVAVALCSGAPSTAPAQSQDYWRDCGERIVGEALIVTTKAHAVSCRIARRVARRYAADGDLHPLGFDCREPSPDPSGETQKGTCRREGARIRVVFGI